MAEQAAPLEALPEQAETEQAGTGPTEPEKPAIATPEMVKASEKAALGVHKKLSVQAAPVRQYLEATVVPVVMQGMQAVCKERPENPVEYLAYYLLSHNPHPSTTPSQPMKPSTEAVEPPASTTDAPAAAPTPTPPS